MRLMLLATLALSADVATFYMMMAQGGREFNPIAEGLYAVHVLLPALAKAALLVYMWWLTTVFAESRPTLMAGMATFAIIIGLLGAWSNT